tara:strand:- start:21769 stop:22071 length:303 start_codon:yes stop_codon:yes gene_type:complete
MTFSDKPRRSGEQQQRKRELGQSLLDLASAPLLALSVGVLLGAWLGDPLGHSRGPQPAEVLALPLEALPEERLRARILQAICYRQAVSLHRKEAKSYSTK